MKKVFFTLIIVMLCLSVHAQITKIHTFSNVSFNCSKSFDQFLFSSNYIYLDGNTYYFYNWDFILTGTITITYIPEGYDFAGANFFSRKCFNNDDKIEMLVAYKSQNCSYNYPECNDNTKLCIINEDNVLIQDLGNFNYGAGYTFQKNNNELRFIIYKYLTNEDDITEYYCDIYRCTGSGDNINENYITNNSIGPAYPNPAHYTITLPYNINGNQTSEMHIYDIQGRLVKTIQVGPHFNEVNVDVSSFLSGTYIYECNGVSNKFVVN